MRFKVGPLCALLAFALPASAQTKVPDVCATANQLLAQHDYQGAAAQYEACLRAAPPTFELFSNLGIAYAGQNQFEQAIRAYTQALALNPDSPPLHLNLGLAYLKTGRTAQAAEEFARAEMGDLENLQAEELLAFCHYQLGQYALAGVEAERVLKARPDEASANFLLGSSYFKMGRYKQAIPLLYFSVQKTSTADTHSVLGQAFLGVKAYRQALNEFEKAQQLSPEMPGIHAELGEAYAGLGQTDKAIAEFERELAKDPKNFEATYYLGRLKRLASDYEAARKYLARADELHPNTPSVQYEYAVLAIQDKDYARAEALLRKILAELPGYTDAHVLLSEVYFKTHRAEEGRREKALVDAMRKIEQAETDAEGKALQERSAAKPAGDAAHRP